jgi:hypothetical protein
LGLFLYFGAAEGRRLKAIIRQTLHFLAKRLWARR